MTDTAPCSRCHGPTQPSHWGHKPICPTCTPDSFRQLVTLPAEREKVPKAQRIVRRVR